MDDLVRAAMAKWPSVPACYGWLGLDARGDWYMRDDRVQAHGAFGSALAAKGSRIEHEKLKAFIERNYLLGEDGAAYFQNGPQQVFVELEAAPWVIGLQAYGGRTAIHLHTGPAVHEVRAVYLDEAERLYLSTEWGLGLVRSMDMAVAALEVERGAWQPQVCARAQLLAEHRVCLSPQALAKKNRP